jgi:hypothetical protein
MKITSANSFRQHHAGNYYENRLQMFMFEVDDDGLYKFSNADLSNEMYADRLMYD